MTSLSDWQLFWHPAEIVHQLKELKMPSTKTREATLQLTISLSEVERLRAKVTQLEQEIAELETEKNSLKMQIHDLTDSGQKADAAAFKRARGTVR